MSRNCDQLSMTAFQHEQLRSHRADLNSPFEEPTEHWWIVEGLEEIKRDAAERWVRAVNVEGSFGVWNYRMAKQVSEVPGLTSAAAKI